MLKFATLIRADGITINPLLCSQVCSYLKGEVIIMTHFIYIMMNQIQSIREFGIKDSVIVVIEDAVSAMESGLGSDVITVSNIKKCVQLLSETFPNKGWWLIGDNAMANNLIKQGLIMDVHIAISHINTGSSEWITHEKHMLKQTESLNKYLLTDAEMEFKKVSDTRCGMDHTKQIQHFHRRNYEEKNLLSAMYDIISNGHNRPNRTGIDTRSLFGRQFEYKMVERIDPNTGKSSFRFPLLTTKKMFVRGVFAELKWFLSGSTDSKILERKGVNIWKGNSSRTYLDSVGLKHYEEGQCGKIYGHQFRNFNGPHQISPDCVGKGVDQVANVIRSLQEDPFSRRHIISLWNASDLDKMCLPPCHVLYIFYVHEENNQKYLSLNMTQRSADTLLGVPFNVASCCLFLLMMAHRVRMKPHKFVHSIADFHLYENHIDIATKQIQREPCMFPYVSIVCNPKQNIEDYEFSEIKIEDYFSHSKLSADMVA